MRIAFTGAAGIGKTTTATAIAAARGLPLLGEDFADVVRAFNTRPHPQLRAHQAVACEAWLDRREAAYAAHPQGWVEDRCAIDVLFRWLIAGVSDADNALTQRTVERARELLALLDALVMLPLAETAEAINNDGLQRAGSASRLWRAHSLALGLALQLMPPARVLVVPRECASVQQRVDWVLEHVAMIGGPHVVRGAGFGSR